jgi:ABC-type uncharacterized transport system permease subunit
MILSPTLPSQPALWPSVLAISAYFFAAAWPSNAPQGDKRHERPIWWALSVGWLAQAVAIVLDTVVEQSGVLGARFGFGTALSITSWLVMAVYAYESRHLGLPSVRRVLAVVAGVTVAVAWLFPGQVQSAHGSSWTPLHWLLGFASYGLFGAALLHAVLWRHAEQQLRPPPGASGTLPLRARHGGQALGMPLLRLEALTMQFVRAGFVMLSLTLLLGFWFTPWHWDHKSVFSLLSWVVFAILLVGRARFGWRGRMAIRWLVIGSALLLLAYVGSRFVLEVILHRAIPV